MLKTLARFNEPRMTSTSEAISRPSMTDRWMAPLLVTIVVVLGFGLKPDRLPLQGEETCRALHGIEMAASGDWLFATNQGVRIIDRPPLHYWTLAVIHRFIHPLDPTTIRLVMFATTLATALLIWWYASRFLGAPASVLAGVAYPTLGHVFDLGRRAETDAQFALLVSASLFAWHLGYARGRSRYATWMIAGFLAALASLTKGLQAPVAYFGATYLFLLLVRDWRWLLHPSNVAGIAVFLATIAIWQIPFYRETGWDGFVLTWFKPGASRVEGGLSNLLGHMTLFPLAVAGATLPWSPLLFGMAFRSFWKHDAAVRSTFVFMLCGIAAIAVPVWIMPGGSQRYVMPMYPLLSVLIGVVGQQCLGQPLDQALRRFGRDYIRVLAILAFVAMMCFLGFAAIPSVADIHWSYGLIQPIRDNLIFAALAIPAAIVAVRCAFSVREREALLANFAIGALLVLLFNGPVLNTLARRAVDVRPNVAALHAGIPEGKRLVSLGRAHPRLVYYYPEPIPIVRRPWSADDVPDDLEYFVIEVDRGESLSLPFEWEELGRLNMDRLKSDDPEDFMVIGRRKKP